MRRIAAVLKRAIRNFLDHNAALHAAGLTYYSLLSVIPVLCCVLVMAKMCGVGRIAQEQIDRRLDAMIVNLEHGQDDGLAVLTSGDETERALRRKVAIEFGQQARHISRQLFERIESFDIRTFGWIGFGLLLWTVISTLSSVESSFNLVRGVPKSRAIWKRAYVYPFVMVIVPILAALAMSLPVLGVVKRVVLATGGVTVVTRWLSNGLIWVLDSRLFMFLIVLFFATMTFTFLYWLLPNDRVRLRASAVGGLVTAVLFGSWWKICVVAQVGISGGSMLYGSCSLLPIVLTWLFVSWQIVIFGACLVQAVEAQEQEEPSAEQEGVRT